MPSKLLPCLWLSWSTICCKNLILNLIKPQLNKSINFYSRSYKSWILFALLLVWKTLMNNSHSVKNKINPIITCTIINLSPYIKKIEFLIYLLRGQLLCATLVCWALGLTIVPLFFVTRPNWICSPTSMPFAFSLYSLLSGYLHQIKGW